MTKDAATQTLESALLHLEDRSLFWSHQFSRNIERNLRRVMENVMGELESRIADSHDTLSPAEMDQYWSKGLRCMKKWNADDMEDDMRKIRSYSSHFDDQFDQTFRCFVDQSFTHLSRGKVDTGRVPDVMWFYKEYVHSVCDLPVVQSRTAYQNASYVARRIAFVEALEIALERCVNECVAVQTIPDNPVENFDEDCDREYQREYDEGASRKSASSKGRRDHSIHISLTGEHKSPPGDGGGSVGWDSRSMPDLENRATDYPHREPDVRSEGGFRGYAM